jgi:puromycin-sensitive aminopeptidase
MAQAYEGDAIPGFTLAYDCRSSESKTGILKARVRSRLYYPRFVSPYMKKQLWSFLCVLLLASFAMAQRLPETAVPENYKLTFTPDFNKNNFAGEEVITIQMLKPSSQIVLNSADIEINQASVVSSGVTQTPTVTFDKEKEMVTFAVGKELQPGPVTLNIRYVGILNDQLRGFYLGKDAQGHKYAVTQLEATDARRAFPCFDEPAYKATFDITVVADKGLIAISNAKMISDVPGPGEKHTVSFATSQKMSSYLAAIAVGNFEYIEGEVEGIPIRIYSMPGKKELGRFALQATEYSLAYYNRYFGIKYPYGKLDWIALPDFSAGAMENIGFITSREAELQVDEQHVSLAHEKNVAITVTHEIAHQWFGDLVTMSWWDDIWLNEGFATWMEGKPVDAWKPDWHVGLDEVSRGDILTTVGALNIDSLASTRAIHQPVETPGQIQELFDGIAYGKAAAVLRMIETYIGPETFRAGVNEYLKRHAYGNATAEDFWTTLAQVSKKPVDQIMATFVKQPGVPMVSLKAQCTGNSTMVSMKQQRYFYDRAKLDAANDQLWQVPVCLKSGPASGSGQRPQQCELLTKREESFTIPGCSAWVLGNAGGTGYYRTAYEPEAVHALAHDAEAVLTPQERLLLLIDTWASVRVGRQPVGDYLTLAEGVKTEPVTAVMALVLGQLNGIGRNIVTDDDRPAYQLWVRNTLNPVAKRIGWEPKPGESEDAKNLRPLLLNALGGQGHDAEAIAEARNLADRALQNPGSVQSDLANTAFGIAASNSGPDFYEKVMAAMKGSKTPEQYYLYFYTLSDFSDSNLIKRTLDFAISPEVRSQDSLGLIGSVMGHADGQKPAWEFVRSHWDEVIKAGGPFASAQVQGNVGGFCDAAMKDQVQEFFAAHPSSAAERTLRQSMERINNCIAMKTDQSGQLASWLQNQGGASAGGTAAH